ncbi:hypothetical protein FNV43_RR00166 [Rhamnella rubrinervis]|uniref:Uncharacterized protein n=1 Tax=Rhamnella rubrinervis TaxID=2594499 RepID=A0A8K0HPU9_9ROSA|nr:hypothetical protein FNV43_RR00166 [Rhamnella rubrinervis]
MYKAIVISSIGLLETFNADVTSYVNVACLEISPNETDEGVKESTQTQTALGNTNQDYFTRLCAMCPEIDSLRYTLKDLDLGAGDRLDFPNLVVEKIRATQGDLVKLAFWARQRAEMIASAEMQSRWLFREIDLHGMDEELADWVNLGSGRILNAVGSRRPKPINLNSKKREAFG